jgi:hypothetical protein
MKIERFNYPSLRNEEHFQFITEIKELVEKFGAAAINIEVLFALFLVHFANELEALLLVRKSPSTEAISDADVDRDGVINGFIGYVNAGLSHFDPIRKAAAKRLSVLLESYGNIARKPYDDETAALTKLNGELTGNYAADVETLSLSEWPVEINKRNLAFDALMKGRYGEEAAKTALRMRTVRLETDATYRDIADRLDALMLLNGDAAYSPFVKELNARVEKYKLILAQRKGRNSKEDTTTTEQKTT